MKKVIVVIGPGQIGQAIARRVGVGKHIVLADMDPSDEGQRLTRTYALEGEDTLLLSGKWTYQGETLGFQIKFTRVKPSR